MGIERWSTTGSNNTNSDTGINWDEGMPPSSVNDSARDTMAAIREQHDALEWPVFGRNSAGQYAYSISFVSTTVFKFTSTDRRTLVPVGRRVKAGVGAGTIYGTCTAVTLSASDTQATIAWDSGQLDSSLSYIAIGVINSANSSFPVQRDSYPHFADATDPTKRLRIDCGSISASTIRVWTAADTDVSIGKQPSRQAFTSGGGSYVTPSGATRIVVRAWGGGGGGGGGGSAGSSGGSTQFGTLTASGGGRNGGAAGTGTNGDLNLTGCLGGPAYGVTGGRGGSGGAAPMSGPAGDGGGESGGGGQSAAANSGGGGGGGGGVTATGAASSGGSGGGYLEKFFFASITASFSYSIGAAGTGDAAGAGSGAGGNGGSGLIIVDEFYN